MPESLPAARTAPFPLTTELSERAVAALVASVRRREATLGALEDAIAACVRSLRDQGMTAGAMIITMKAFVRHALEVAPPAGFATSSVAVELLTDRVVSWSIAEFYRKVRSS